MTTAALVARGRYTRQVGVQELLVDAEQRRYDLSSLRYREGIDAYLTVLTAQQDHYSAQNTLISTRTDRLANLVTLYKALGGGWRWLLAVLLTAAFVSWFRQNSDPSSGRSG